MDKNLQVLYTLATHHRDYADFAAENMIDCTFDAETLNGLAEETLLFLSENPQQAEQIRLLQSSEMKSIGLDIGILVAVTFLLRTHVKVSRSEAGKWSLLIEHKPENSKILEKLLKRLDTLMM